MALTAAFISIGDRSLARAQTRVDVLIRGGSVYDGSGGAPRLADVGIVGDRIAFVGEAPASTVATRVIEARGLVVTPGFIDPHTHTDADVRDPLRRGLPGYLLQGVTTVIIGNDGGGPLEIGAVRRQLERGIGVNAAYLVGHGTIRRAVLGMAARPPSPSELDTMRAMVAQAMAEGAFGLSTGLYYAPGSYAETSEVIELAKVAAAAGGYYDSHIRDESSYTVGLLGAIDEAIRVGREASIPVHIAHIKALGVDVWGKSDDVVARILAARASGLRVTADQYPYSASGSSIGASLLPRWAEAGGRDSLLGRIARAASRAKLVVEMTENLRRRGGPESLLLTSGRWRGKRLAKLATELGLSPIDAALEIVKAGDASVASFNMHDADIDRLMMQEFVVTGSDGSAGHPRKYGTFPRKLRHYVLDRGVISLTRAIRASSAQTAEIVGLTDRGTVAPGRFADVVVFDSTAIADRSTYEAPELLSVGIQFVLVNGKIAVDRGRPTAVLSGRALRRER
jgi:N-acyl-D-aspartate/D-glutamate deacylase